MAFAEFTWSPSLRQWITVFDSNDTEVENPFSKQRPIPNEEGAFDDE
jgi:hypothetical protein